MRTNRTLLLGIFLAIALTGLIPSTSATGTQWFADENTTVEYSVTHYLTFQSGLKTECSDFILYNFSNTQFYAVPTILRTYFSSVVWPGTIISSDTSLRIQHTYSNQSATHLRKKVTIIWDEGSFPGNGKSFYLILFEYNSVDNIYDLFTTNFNIPKETIPAYSSHYDPFYIHEYINCTAGVLEPTPYFITNVMISPSHIIARWELGSISPLNANFTYVADGNGQVLSLGYAAGSAEMDAANLVCASYGFSVIAPPSTGIPSFHLSWTILTFLGAVFLVPYLLKGIRNKQNL